VLNVEAEHCEMSCDQNAAMTFERLFLGAHEGKIVSFHSLLDAL
jgi:hypothetical protein